MTKQQAQKLEILIERWTRADILSRFGGIATRRVKDSMMGIDFTMRKLKYEDKIREVMFGESDTVKLAERWGILTEDEKKSAKSFRKKYKPWPGIKG